MDQLALPLFLFNSVMILVDASVGYHMAPLLLSGVGESDIAETAVRTSRRLLPAIVALYMFFNCMGYFQGLMSYLLMVSGMIAFDLTLQFYLRHRKRAARDNADDEEY